MTFGAPEGGNIRAASWSSPITVTIVFLLLGVMFGCLAGSLGFLITESGIAADIQNLIPKTAEIRALTTKGADRPTATMVGIKHQLQGDVITVTISLDTFVQYETHRLHNPERMVIDLLGTRLDPKVHRIIAVNQGGLLVIRINQFKPETARIVLDLASQSDYWINATADPPRLIIKLSKRELEDGPELAEPQPRARPSRPITIIGFRWVGSGYVDRPQPGPFLCGPKLLSQPVQIKLGAPAIWSKTGSCRRASDMMFANVPKT